MAWAEKQRSGRYLGIYRTKKGERRTTGETFTRKSDARRAAADLESESRKRGWHDPKNGDITWGEWRSQWEAARQIEGSTAKNERSMIDTWISPFWQDAPLAEITHQDVQEWLTEMRSTNTAVDEFGEEDKENPRYLATASVRRYLNPFVSSLTAAVEAGRIPANPAYGAKLPPIPEPDRVFLTKDEYAALYGALVGDQARAEVEFLVTTGVRFGEFAGLHKHRILPDRSMAQVQEVWDGEFMKPYPKGKRGRNVPLVERSLALWEPTSAIKCGVPHREGRCRSGLAFPARRGGVWDHRNFARSVLRPALKRAGLDDLGFTPHDFRHTYASWLAQDGVPLGRIAQLLGHASTRTTEIYAHFRPAESDDIQRALSGGLASRPASTEDPSTGAGGNVIRGRFSGVA